MNAEVSREKKLVAFVAGFYAAWILRVVVLLPVDYRIHDAWLKQCWSQSLRVLMWIVPVFLFLKYADRVRPLAFLKLDRLPRGRQAYWGAGITAVFIGVTVASALLVQGGSAAKLKTMTGNDWALLLFGMGCVAFAEELLYRGFLLQKLRERFPFQRANAAVCLLFLLIHWPGWLYMQGFHAGLFGLSASILVVSWFLGFLMEKTRSLWPPIVLHLANNIISGTLLP